MSLPSLQSPVFVADCLCLPACHLCGARYKAVTGVLFMNEASYKLWKTILGHREKALQELHKAIDTTTQQLRGATP